MNQEFVALRDRLARAEPSLIEPYAATSPAEFFAVATELFFEQPQALAAERPELYEQLKRCYRLDPGVVVARGPGPPSGRIHNLADEKARPLA